MKISASLVRTYKTCKRKYELKYLENLEPIVKSQSLQDGTDYHSMIEDFYNGKGLGYEEGMNPKICAMAMAYFKYLWQLNEELKEVEYVEKWFEYPLTKKHYVIGRNDALAKNDIPVEHKTVSCDIDDEYIYSLQWDEQILTYMLANSINEMYYTVIKKPTIRQRQNESDAEFFNRCLEWYDENTEKKVRLIKVTRSFVEIEEHRKDLIVMANEIENCKHFYRNPSACTCFNRRCEYSQVCLNYNPSLEYVDYEKKERFSKEIKENGLF